MRLKCVATVLTVFFIQIEQTREGDLTERAYFICVSTRGVVDGAVCVVVGNVEFDAFCKFVDSDPSYLEMVNKTITPQATDTESKSAHDS